METQTIFTLLAPLAFAVGFALQKGNVCSVLAAREIAQTGKWIRLRGLLLTSAFAFIILLPMVWLDMIWPDYTPFKLSQQVLPGLITILAGMIYGFGCYLTGACIFGICSRTTAGHVSFAFAIPAMAGGAWLGKSSGLAPTIADQTPTIAETPTIGIGILWAILFIWLARSAFKTFLAHKRAGITIRNLLFQSRWRSAFAAIIIGSIGALLFATDTAWFYPAATLRVGLYLTGMQSSLPLDSIVGGLALFAGGIAAASLKGRVIYRPPHLLPSIQAILGGTVIGFAWALIPGGNDALVLYLIPSTALNGIIAYIAMFFTLIALEQRKMRQQ